MTLDEILKPAKWDEQVLRQYTKVGKKLKLDEGKKRYWVGVGLGITFNFLSTEATTKLYGEEYERWNWYVLGFMDMFYNWNGVLGFIQPEVVSDTKVLNPFTSLSRKYNSILRLPVLAAGIGMVGRYGIDLFNNLVNGVPMDSDSHHYLNYGLGLLAVSSSMYIKEMDPKLLDKAPFWETAYHWAKEKASSLVPKPVPQPVPSTSFSLEKQIADYI